MEEKTVQLSLAVDSDCMGYKNYGISIRPSDDDWIETFNMEYLLEKLRRLENEGYKITTK